MMEKGRNTLAENAAAKVKFTNVQEIARFTNAEQEVQDVRMLRVKDQQLYWIWLRINGTQIMHFYLQKMKQIY